MSSRHQPLLGNERSATQNVVRYIAFIAQSHGSLIHAYAAYEVARRCSIHRAGLPAQCGICLLLNFIDVLPAEYLGFHLIALSNQWGPLLFPIVSNH